jgi:hypothetical protein
LHRGNLRQRGDASSELFVAEMRAVQPIFDKPERLR